MLLPGSMDTQDAGLKARRVAVDIPSAAEAESIRCHFAAWLKPCPDVLLPSIWRTERRPSFLRASGRRSLQDRYNFPIPRSQIFCNTTPTFWY